MTEVEWMACAEIKTMLELFRNTWKHSFFEFCKSMGVLRQNRIERKFRLFACACMRHAWEQLDEPTRRATEFAERYADAKTKRSVMYAAGERQQIHASAAPTIKFAGDAALHSANEAANLLASNSFNDPRRSFVLQHLSTLLQDIIGNPFRPITLNSSWLTNTVVALATGIYEEKAFDRMPILADALQDAGCDNEDILKHCRQPSEHVRGCFVVDLLLGKK